MNAIPKTQLFLGITLKCEEPVADGMRYHHTVAVTSANAVTELSLESLQNTPYLARLAAAGSGMHLQLFILVSDTSEHRSGPITMSGGIHSAELMEVHLVGQPSLSQELKSTAVSHCCRVLGNSCAQLILMLCTEMGFTPVMTRLINIIKLVA